MKEKIEPCVKSTVQNIPWKTALLRTKLYAVKKWMSLDKMQAKWIT